MKARSQFLLTTLFLTVANFNLHATNLTSDDFEDGTFGNWSVDGGNDAGLYENGDVVSNMEASDAEINYAPNGEFSLWDGRGGSDLRLTELLDLASPSFTSVTISFDYKVRSPSATRRIRTSYSSDGGQSWTELGFVTGDGSKTYILDAETDNLTTEASFRFAFSDSGGRAGPAFVDNVVITGVGGSDPDTFAGWINGFDVDGLTGFNDDPDQDGKPNGVEALLGTDPSQFTLGLSPLIKGASSSSFTHPQADPGLSDLSGKYQWSTDLELWFDNGAESDGLTVSLIAERNTPTDGTTTVTATTTGPEPRTIFVRAVATQE